MVEMNERFIPATSVREMFGFGDLTAFKRCRVSETKVSSLAELDGRCFTEQ